MGERISISYPHEAVFVGPAPGSGFHFVSYSGRLNNEYQESVLNHNLVRDLTRVQSVSYEVNLRRQPIARLGKKSSEARPLIESPSVDLGISWLAMGLKNEARLGLTVNYAQFHMAKSGDPFYTGNFSVDLFSGMMSRNRALPTGDPFWPFQQREPKNIFIAITRSGDELYRRELNYHTGDFPIQQQNDWDARDYDVICFGDCYMTSYAFEASIGAPPMASARFVGESMTFVGSGSGAEIPALFPKDRTPISGRTFRIPGSWAHEGPSVLNPGDITVDIKTLRRAVEDWGGLGLATESEDYEDLTVATVEEDWGNILDALDEVEGTDFDVNFSGAWIHGYSMGFTLDREPLRSLGYKLPLDRPINYPIVANFSFDAVVNERQTGALYRLTSLDKDYLVTLRMKNPDCPNEGFPVPPYVGKLDAVRHDFRYAKLDSVSWSNSIGGKKTATFSFSCESHPDDIGITGFYISGLLNIDKVEDTLLYSHASGSASGDGEVFLTPSGDQIVTNLIPVVV